MSSDWSELTLEDSLEVLIDYRGKTPKKTNSGIPLVTAKIIKAGRIEPVNEYISESDYETWMVRGIPNEGDVVITTEAPLGEVAQLGKEKIALAQRVITLRGKKDLLDNTFLKYLMISEYVQHQLDGRATGTTVSGIKQSELRKVILKFPGLVEQKAIARVLGTLDDKIELNRQMNETLESMAQALFKSWFVDFDPVIDNALAAGNPIPDALKAKATQRAEQLKAAAQSGALPATNRELFPSEYAFTEELGWIPKGWKVGKLSKIASHIKVNKRAEDINNSDLYVGLEHIEKKNIFLSNFSSGEVVSSNKSCFEVGDILFGKLRPYFHKVCLAPESGICSTDILVFRSKNSEFSSFLTLTLFADKLVEHANLRSTGTRMPRANAKDILDYPVLIFSSELAFRFESLVSDNFKVGLLNNRKNLILSELRDTLLPKLLSGELRVAEAAALVEGV